MQDLIFLAGVFISAAVFNGLCGLVGIPPSVHSWAHDGVLDLVFAYVLVRVALRSRQGR
jgi:hypothetical protein